MFSPAITVFSSNYSSNSGGVFSKISHAKYESSISSDVYQQLSNYALSIKTLTEEYAQGEFSLVADILNLATYETMSTELYNLAKDSTVYPDYEILRQTICSALAGLYQSILQHVNLLETENQLADAQQFAAILKDPAKLQDYINRQKTRRNLFPESNVSVGTSAQLRPEYARYIALYGFPAGAVFEMDKLAEILRELE
jgi:hypothetical protein